jgi:hypothetical protein
LPHYLVTPRQEGVKAYRGIDAQTNPYSMPG